MVIETRKKRVNPPAEIGAGAAGRLESGTRGTIAERSIDCQTLIADRVAQCGQRVSRQSQRAGGEAGGPRGIRIIRGRNESGIAYGQLRERLAIFIKQELRRRERPRVDNSACRRVPDRPRADIQFRERIGAVEARDDLCAGRRAEGDPSLAAGIPRRVIIQSARNVEVRQSQTVLDPVVICSAGKPRPPVEHTE